MRVRRGLRRIAESRPTWVVGLALTLGVGLPAACVIWFMTEAASSQADSARLRLSDALRGQLRLIRERVDADWRAHLARVNDTGRNRASDFARIVTSGGVDSVVLLTPGGAPAYPAPLPARRDDGTSGGAAWQTAGRLEAMGRHEEAAAAYAAIASAETNVDRVGLAAQAHVRVLSQAGRALEARRVIDTYPSVSSVPPIGVTDERPPRPAPGCTSTPDKGIRQLNAASVRRRST